MHDVVTYSEKAHDAAIQSGKKLKNTEIAVRKMAAKLRDIKRSLDFRRSGARASRRDRLESLRTELLSHMFGKRTNELRSGKFARLFLCRIAAFDRVGAASPDPLDPVEKSISCAMPPRNPTSG